MAQAVAAVSEPTVDTMKELGVEVGREVALAIGRRPSTPDALACGEEVSERAIVRGLRLRGWVMAFRLSLSAQSVPSRPLEGKSIIMIVQGADGFDQSIAQAFLDGVSEGWKEMAPSLSGLSSIFGAW